MHIACFFDDESVVAMVWYPDTEGMRTWATQQFYKSVLAFMGVVAGYDMLTVQYVPHSRDIMWHLHI